MPRSGSRAARSASTCRGILSWPAALLVVSALLAGCGRKDDHHQDHDHDHSHEHDHDHKPPSGASFKAGEGITLAAETRRILAVETAEVSRRKLPQQIRFTVQVFGEKHHHALNPSDHSGCDVQGSGLVSTNTAAVVKAGQPVQIHKGTNHPLGGVVLGVQKALALGESEIIIGVSNAMALLQPGEFIPARIVLPRDEPVVTIPEAALLRTAEGTFVYAANGNAFLRRTVTAGTEADGWVEIMAGLQPGEQVVAKPVQTLWLIELRETKGGGHSH
jgi:multidrug efflux pump subunit AcrA (membrane-fusion protein)/predicted small lipoprotein YifL